MAINIKYRPLKAFLLAAETGSFTQAARRLGVTQPSFTALIRDLEDIVGTRLFDRTTRSLALTDNGRDFLARIERPISDLEEAYRSQGDLAGARRGTVVVGVLPSVALTLAPPTLERLAGTHPGLRVRVVEAHNDELVSLVRTNQVEFAVAALPDHAGDLGFRALVEDRFVAVFPRGHPLARHRSLTWADLVPHELVLLSRGSSIRARYDESLAAAVEAPSAATRYDVTHMTTATALVRRGLGLALLPRLALPELNLTGLVARTLRDANARRTIGILHRADRALSAAAEAFAAQLSNAVARLKQGA